MFCKESPVLGLFLKDQWTLFLIRKEKKQEFHITPILFITRNIIKINSNINGSLYLFIFELIFIIFLDVKS